jgi:glycosyltransferase involved in cell wall biosynthesis
MITSNQRLNKERHLVWVEFNTITVPLYVAARLETTRELRNLGWQVTLVLGGPAGQQSVNGVDVVCIPISETYFWGYFRFHLEFLRFIAKEWSNIDVLLFHHMSAPWLIPLRFIRQIRGDKRPLLVMDTRDRDVPGHGIKNRLRMLFGDFVNSIVNRWADGQTANTERMAKLVRVPKSQLWGIWPSGVTLEDFILAQTKRKWPDAGEPIHLIYIGSLFHHRNLLPMCQAIEEINESNIKFKFSLFGEGTARADLESFAQKTGGRINVFSAVSHDQIPAVLAQAHIGVTSLFSTDEELFQATSPIKLFEYMASGLPILAPRMACHSDVIGAGKYVFWVDQVDLLAFKMVLQQIWESRALLSEMGALATEAASDCTWHESAKKLKAALEYGLQKIL